MIRNVIFDLGNVLVEWSPEALARCVADNASDAALLRGQMFETEVWPSLDRGLLDQEEALLRILAGLPPRLREKGEDLFRHWPAYHLPPLGDMCALARTVKAAGYGVYLLTNSSARYLDFEGDIPVLAEMDGKVVSALCGCAKPDLRIYGILLERYALRAEECFFIDDNPANIAAARELGMQGYVYAMDTDNLRAALAAAGVLL